MMSAEVIRRVLSSNVRNWEDLVEHAGPRAAMPDVEDAHLEPVMSPTRPEPAAAPPESPDTRTGRTDYNPQLYQDQEHVRIKKRVFLSALVNINFSFWKEILLSGGKNAHHTFF